MPRFLRLQLVALVLVTVGTCSQGQDVYASHSTDQIEENPRTLTGCLSKGENADEFELQEENGEVWRVKGDSRELLAQVGHTVTIIGNSLSADDQVQRTGPEAKGTQAASKQSRQIAVANLARVSDGCQNDLPTLPKSPHHN